MTDAAPEEPPATAGDVIRSILGTTAERLFDTETDAMADEPDGLHQHRTHVRRLRSILAGFRDYLDEAAAQELRVRFDEWGSQLGIVRDIEVREVGHGGGRCRRGHRPYERPRDERGSTEGERQRQGEERSSDAARGAGHVFLRMSRATPMAESAMP